MAVCVSSGHYPGQQPMVSDPMVPVTRWAGIFCIFYEHLSLPHGVDC